MRKRPFHLFALGGLAAALVFASQHTPANQPKESKDPPVAVAAQPKDPPAGGIKVSFRSRRVDVATIAGEFGGGGHALASGATLHVTMEEAQQRVLETVRRALQ